MSSLFENIERIATAKEEIRQSIINKGVEVSDDLKIEDYSSKIDLITAGGGGEDWKLTDLRYVAYFNKSAIDNIENIINLVDFDAITEIESFYSAGSSTKNGVLTVDAINKILSKITHIIKLRISITGFYNISEDATIDLNLPNCTDLYDSFNNLANYGYGGMLTFDFHGSTKEVTSWGNAFYGYSSWTPIVDGFLNVAFDKMTSLNSAFQRHPKATRLTFDGSFGGSSTTSSLTLNLSSWTSLTVDAFLETMTTISENTNGNTRIFKLPSALYKSLTDEILLLAADKGYTISA